MRMNEVVHTTDWSQFGMAGAVIGGMFGILVHMYNTHNTERKEWRSDVTGIAEKQQRSVDSLKDIVSDLTMAIKEMSIRGEKKQ